MACKKYILTNNTSQGLTFSYQECSNNMWEYDILLTPGQIRNIWLVNGTFQAALEEQFTIVEEIFPPISPTPSNTPTNTPTPSNTGTQTPTPTNTGTQTPTPSNTGTQTPTPTPTQTPTQTPTNTSTQTPTQTPTNTSTQTPTNTSTQTPTQTPTNTPTQTQTPTNTQTSTPTPSTTEPARYEFVVEFATEQLDACGGYGPELSIWGIDPVWDHNTFFYDSASGPVTTNMEGWYQYSAQVFNLDSNGIVQGPGYLCPTLTPTPTNTQTPTNTPTNTSTPTNTPTNTSTQTQTPTNTSTTTPTPTPTRNHYDYLLSSGATSNDACSNVAQTVYGSLAGGVGPNLGEVLYQSINPLANPVDEAYWSDGTDWYKTDTSGVIVQIDIDGCI